MRGGVSHAPNYPNGHSQFGNNKVISNTYATGGVPHGWFSSAMANPNTYIPIKNNVDNLNHNSPNEYGNAVGSGFPSRGWF
jgi:hypothetical protein